MNSLFLFAARCSVVSSFRNIRLCTVNISTTTPGCEVRWRWNVVRVVQHGEEKRKKCSHVHVIKCSLDVLLKLKHSYKGFWIHAALSEMSCKNKSESCCNATLFYCLISPHLHSVAHTRIHPSWSLSLFCRLLIHLISPHESRQCLQFAARRDSVTRNLNDNRQNRRLRSCSSSITTLQMHKMEKMRKKLLYNCTWEATQRNRQTKKKSAEILIIVK